MSDDILDPESIEFLRELLADRFAELVTTYVSDSEKRFTSLCRAVDLKEYGDIACAAHGLKGSSRNIGANSLANLCGVMESQARSGEIVDGQQQLAAIEKNLAVVSNRLAELV